MMLDDAWKPNPGPQEEALRRIEYEILYGGARGGGKTDAGIVWLTDCIDHPRFRGLVIRKNSEDLSDWVDRASRMWKRYGVRVTGKPAIFHFPSGAVIKTGHLKDDQAYTKYQGHEYHRELIEELTQIPDEKRYIQLTSSCRSSIPELKAQIFSTTNPGGVGHAWVKKRFVDPAPPGTAFRDPTSGRSRIFIPAKIDDNPILMTADPNYVKTLDAIKDTDEELYKAWRLGDWDTFAGQFFREFRRDLHVVRPFVPPATKEVIHIGGLDWGRTAPFSFHAAVLFAVRYIDPKTQDEYKFFRTITYQEVYGTEKLPSEWAAIIAERVDLKNFKFIICDNQIFSPNNDGSTSIYDQFCKANEQFTNVMQPGSKDRIGGWENMHKWLSLAPDGKPYWQMTETCVNLIRTLPLLVHDDNIVEDLDSSGEDHAADDQRYMLKSTKWIDAKAGALRRAPVQHEGRIINVPPDNLNLDKFAKASVDTSRDYKAI